MPRKRRGERAGGFGGLSYWSHESHRSYKSHLPFSSWAPRPLLLPSPRVDGRSRLGGRGKSEHHKAACCGKVRRGPGRKRRSMESVTENIPPGRARTGVAVRVKRRGKSPPPGGQPPGHDKPHAVQGQTGTPGRLSGGEQSPPVPGIGRMRVARHRAAGRNPAAR